MLARRLPINTKTKLDLTKLFLEFHNSFLFVAKVGIKQVLANYNRQKSRFYR